MLRLAKLEADSSFPIEKLDLLSLTQDVVSVFHLEAENRKIHLSVSGKSSLMEGNSVMLEQMIANLCENAIKYNRPEGSVSVTVAPTGVDQVRLVVEDSGIGIDDIHKERVFERFYRVDKSRSKQTGGTGLGLSIVKHCVERHHGEIHLQSQLDVGTSIEVLLPCSQPREPEREANDSIPKI